MEVEIVEESRNAEGELILVVAAYIGGKPIGKVDLTLTALRGCDITEDQKETMIQTGVPIAFQLLVDDSEVLVEPKPTNYGAN